MAGSSIKIDELAAAIEKELSIYSDEITSGIKKLVPKVAKEAVKELNDTSPVNRKSGRRPHYKDQWKQRKTNETLCTQENTVYNEDYRLPHLVEKGHALRNGGRTRAQPHIAPAEEKAIEKFEKGAEEIIRNGGQ